MDGEAQGHGLRPTGKQQSNKGFLEDVDDLEETGSGVEECTSKTPQKEMTGLLNKIMQHNGCSESDPELLWGSSGRPLTSSVWTMREEEELKEDVVKENDNIQDNLLHSWCTAEGTIIQIRPALEYWVYLDKQHRMEDCDVEEPVSPSDSLVLDRPHLFALAQSSVAAAAVPEVSSFICDAGSPAGSPCSMTNGSAWDALRCSSSSICSSDQDPVSAAAHLHLLGESLSLIGHHLQETNKMVCMSSSFSLLLDSLLCAMAPLMCLTTQIPELSSCTEHTVASTLENISYVMPGL